MVNRWIGILALLAMLFANLFLIQRDILPRWFAGDPPQPRALSPFGPKNELFQTGIYDGESRSIGYVWTEISRGDDGVIRQKIETLLHARHLPGATLPMTRLEMDLVYVRATAEGKVITNLDEPTATQTATQTAPAPTGNGLTYRLDELDLRLEGLPFDVKLEGEHILPDDFPCQWQFDTLRGSFVLPAYTTRALGHAFRPLGNLTGLRVGQAWRVQLFNPLAGAMPGANFARAITDEIFLEVKRQETIAHRGRDVLTFVVESEHTRAWVDERGTVLRQQVELPLFGTLMLVEEEFDDETRQRELNKFALAKQEQRKRD